MEVLSDNIKVENTHPNNQNGVALGENVPGTDSIKLNISAGKRAVGEHSLHQTSSNQPRYSILNSSIFSHSHQLTSERMLSIAEQSYIIPPAGTHPVFPPSTTTQIRLPSGSSQYSEHPRMRMFGMTTTESLQAPSSVHSFVTSSGFALGYPANSDIDYAKGPQSSQPSSNSQYYQNNDFTITTLESPTASEESEGKVKRVNVSVRIDNKFETIADSVSESIRQVSSGKIQEADEDEDEDTSSDEEDVHVCGRCKQIFHTLNEYMGHKSSKVCKSAKSAIKPSSSTSPVIPISNRNPLETPTKNEISDSQNMVASTEKMSVETEPMMETPNKNMMSLDNQSMLETTVKSVMSISNLDVGHPHSNHPHTPIKTQTISNQNILETAAKNTIFRDSFISLEEPTNMRQLEDEDEEEHDISPQDMPPPVSSPPPRDVTAQHEEHERKDKSLLMMKMGNHDSIEIVKKRRGRPPKSSYGTETTTMSSNTRGETNEDSPPKAKRKSRPPRRHKPDEDLSEVPLDMALEDENFNVQFPAMDEGVVPTVENIQKLFSGAPSGRGRGGRGKKRGPHPLHRCPICQLLFPSRLTMVEHKRKHSKLFRCKICNEGFYTEDKLEKHLSKETHNYPCDSCERILISKQALMRHRMSHSDKLFKCEVCARAFKTCRDLKNHSVGMHSETRDFVCQVCNKGFSRREKLKRHLMIHAPDRPVFTCPFKNHVGCDKTFYRKDKLTRHLYSHSKVKPFKCDQCDKSFARTDNLREHIRSHTGVFRYYCTVCGKGQPGPKKFLQHMLKQHNVENADIPKPFEELAPEPLIQQHKAVVQAETAAKLARATSNMKKEREKSGHKIRKEELDGQELHVDPHHVTLATMNNMGIHAVNASSLLASPTSQTVTSEQQTIVQSRANIESLYTINQHNATSPQFQISRHVPEGMVRHISESILRENLAREGLNRETTLREGLSRENISAQPTIARHLNENGEVRLQEGLGRHHLVESPHLSSETIRRQISETTVVQPTRDVQEVQQTLSQGMTVEAEGNIPVSTRGLQLLSHGVLPGNLQFTTLLNSDLVAIGEAVIRNQNGIPTMFQQKFGPAQ